MTRAAALTIALLAAAASCRPSASVAAKQTSLRPIVIAEPLERWSRDGFVEMAPIVRSSIATGGGTQTRVWLRLPEGGVVTAPQGRLMFPPGTESDRVSYVLGASGKPVFVDDVRGTRWDAQGREYFHVYMPHDERAASGLIGVEWSRADPDEERAATDWLVQWSQAHGSPGGALDEDRFRALNHCQSCHVADKAEATSDDDDMPPWPTDGRGLYAPLAVLSAHAVLSSSPSFDDPNAGDPFMKARCPKGAARLRGGAGDHWYTCSAGMPIGERDLAAAMRASDDYAIRTCRARHYLVDHMDDAARARYAEVLAPCP